MPITSLPNGTDICLESFGPEEAPALLLISGLSTQMIRWQGGFISEMLDRGFRVIRFDNRDVGLSSKTPGEPPDVPALLAKSLAGEPVDAPYTLSDMAQDGVGVLDHLGVDAAHVLGTSLGGMIAQMMAIEHPDRVRTLTSVMSTTGAAGVGQARPEAMAVLAGAASAPPERDAYVEHSVAGFRVFSGPLFDEAQMRGMFREAHARCFHPQGSAFQVAAGTATGDRTEALRRLDVPTLVIHGRIDPLIDLTGGEATASAISGADLLVLGQMGHDLPRRYWPQIADAVLALSLRADTQ